MPVGIQQRTFKPSHIETPENRAPRPLRTVGSVWAFARRSPGFTILVIIPVILAFIYCMFIEANIYQSTAQYLIQEANQSTTLTSLGTFLQSTGIASTSNDAYTVNTYLQSRDALANLEKDPGIRAIYNRPEADFLNRFPNFLFGPSFENLYNHYVQWTDVSFDSGANITTLTITAFRPRDAQAIAARLLTLSETEVNRINDRVRDDALRAARREVATLQGRLIDLQQQITAFRNHQEMLDPTQTSTLSVSLLSTLESDLVSARAAVAQLEKAAPNSPELPALRQRVAALQAQASLETVKGAGASTSLAPKLSDYQALLLRQQFLQQMLQSAVTSLENAEATVQQQQLYIARVEAPSLPDRPFYPFKRLVDFAIVTVTLLLVYGVGRVLVGAVREHVAE